MAKRKAAPKDEPEVTNFDEPVEVVFCSVADLIGTPRPDGGAITTIADGDEGRVAKAAVLVREALNTHPDPDAKVTVLRARWANIVGAVDLRALGEFGDRYYDALAALTPSDG